MLKSLISEYGLRWICNRSLYATKIKMMSVLPFTEKLFEKNVHIQRLNIFKIETNDIKNFLVSLPDEKKSEIIHIADNAVKGIITGFSSTTLDYGNPINWHYNPLTGKKTDKNTKWYRIRDFDPVIGDIKVIWEASRFTHFYSFARAYLLSSNELYYKAFSAQLADWVKNNQYSLGANYKCGQECSIRMINTLIAYTVFRDLITEEDEINVKLLVEGCYKKVLSNFFYAYRCIKNNHTLSEICGLIIGAWCCKDERGLSKAYKLMDKEVKKQFTPDGGYIQYSFNYQRFALQILECLFKISEVTGLTISDSSKELIKNSALLLYNCQDQTGDVPNYGSNDGALIFPVTICGYRDFTPVINTVYAIVSGEILYDPGYHDEELLWFGSMANYTRKNIIKDSHAYYNAGVFLLRKTDSFLVTYLSSYKTRPAHMDGLHIDLWHKGRNIFCDPGTFSYADKLGKELCKTSFHNTVKLSDKEQMSSHGNFMIYGWYKRKNIIFKEKYFKGTVVSKNGYEHTREILINKDGYQINDEITGGNGKVEIRFHTPYEVKRVSDGFELCENDVHLASVHTDIVDFELCKGFRSIYYLKKEEINQIILKSQTGKAVKIYVQLY